MNCYPQTTNGITMNLKWNIKDLSRLEIARKFWNGRSRDALLDVWMDETHPGRERFIENRDIIVGLLESKDPERYAKDLRSEGHSLRTLIREIPVIFPKEFKQARIKRGLRLPNEKLITDTDN